MIGAAVRVADDAAAVLEHEPGMPALRRRDPLRHLRGRRRHVLERDHGVRDVGRVDRGARGAVGLGGGPYRQHVPIVADLSTMMSRPHDIPGRGGAAARAAQGLSASALAERSGVSRAMIAKIERADAQPTAALLGRLSAALGMTLSELVARAEHADRRLARAADQPTWTDPETGYRRRAVSPTAGGPLELVEVELPPGAQISYPADAYVFTHEQLWVLEGHLRFVEGERDARAGRRRLPASSARRRPARSSTRRARPAAISSRSLAERHHVLMAGRARRGRLDRDQVARDRLVRARREEQRRVAPALDGEQRRARQQVVARSARPRSGVAGSKRLPTTSTGLAVTRLNGPV